MSIDARKIAAINSKIPLVSDAAHKTFVALSLPITEPMPTPKARERNITPNEIPMRIP